MRVQKLYNEVRVSGMCAGCREVKVFYSVFVRVCMSVNTLTRIFVSLISAAAAYKGFLFGDTLIFLQWGAN